MKKTISILLLLCFLVSVFASCSKIKFNINFIVDGNQYASISTTGSEIISLPEDPEKIGYIFKGWYWDVGVWSQPFTANSLLNAPLTSNMNVYAYFINPNNLEENKNPDSNVNKPSGSVSYMNAYVTQAEKTTLINSYTDGTYNYFIFKIGSIENVPLHCYQNILHDGITERKFSVSSTEIQNSQISYSKTKTVNNAVSAEVSANIAAKVQMETGATAGTVSANAKTSLESSISTICGETYSHLTSENVQNQFNIAIENMTTTEQILGSDAPKGYYRRAIICECDVYITVVCNLKENTYAFEYSMLVKDGTIIPDALLYSETQSLKGPQENLLSFDFEILDTVDLFDNLDSSEEIVYEIDLSQFFKYNSQEKDCNLDFKNVYNASSDAIKYYDPNTGIFMLNSSINNKEIDKYIIKGGYGLRDSNGRTNNTILNNLSFCIFSTHDITIEFSSMAFQAANQRSAVFLDAGSENDISITILSTGSSNIIKGSTADSEDKYAAIWLSDVKKVSVEGYADLSVYGAAESYPSTTISKEEAKNGYEVKDGGVGFCTSNLIVDMTEAKLLIQGGNGKTAPDRIANDNGGNDSDGRNGFNGGHGGNGLVASTLTVKHGNCQIIAGNGGNGGAASEGNGALWDHKRGGNGGNGGNGGTGIVADSVRIEEGYLSVTGGNGGNGGMRGGIHDNEFGKAGNQGKGGLGALAITQSCGTFGSCSTSNGANGSDGSGTNQD